ncbi:molybdenum cofactor carrier [Aeromonas sp. ASNIH7]|uniref:Molybdenum cofactor carrier n=1 Tax=Escherichia coli TaxID=562 RepID=A0A3L0X6T6_ECOLX|nr:molybdenum cofactor carrier [Aeromonas sp. ASNIH7]
MIVDSGYVIWQHNRFALAICSGELQVKPIRQVISGGQTGVDRAALDFAIANRIKHGGWCPQGRKAADGVLDPKYVLQETESPGYSQRTKRNVQDSSGTLIVYRDMLIGGSLLTKRFALQLSKPCFEWALDRPFNEQYPGFCVWLQQHQIEILNIAGPSEARAKDIYRDSRVLLQEIWSNMNEEQ